MSKKPYRPRKLPGKLPMQPIYTNENGGIQFRPNQVVQYLLDNGNLNLNDLASALKFGENIREDWEQFAQLIGYSVNGFGELSYVSDDAYAVAQAIAENPPLTEEQARIAHLEGLLAEARKHARELAAALFRIHPDDLHA